MSEGTNLRRSEEALDKDSRSTQDRYTLRLYVSGATAASGRAIERIKSLCEARLAGRYDLEVVDIYQQPDLVDDERILATPTLVRRLPLPLRRLVGDLSDPDRILMRLDLHPAA